MRLGLVTAILEYMNLEEVIDFASAKDLDCVELACWPQEEGARRYAGVSRIDVRNLTEGKAEYIKQYAKDRDGVRRC